VDNLEVKSGKGILILLLFQISFLSRSSWLIANIHLTRPAQILCYETESEWEYETAIDIIQSSVFIPPSKNAPEE
jgi:hypothetical protein